MEIALKEERGVQIMVLAGKIMGSPEETRISDTISEFIEQNKTSVILDLSKVAWMNSRGLGMCLEGLTRLRNRGGDLRLVGLPAVVKSLMEKCRILPLFQCYNSVAQAVDSFE
jgi:anti-sigma B factor antagonist